MSPDGRTVYVADLNAPAADGTVEALDVATGRLGRPVSVNGPAFRLVITPDGRTMFATDGDMITPVNPATGTAQRAVRTGIDPSGNYQLLMSRDGRTLYISGATRIRRYDIAAGRFGADIAADEPTAMLLSPDGKALWYASGSGQVVAVDVSTGAATARIRVGQYTQSLAMTPDGRTVYVAIGDSGTDEVVPIDVATGIAGPPIRLSHTPGPMAMAPDGRTLYVVLDSPSGPDPSNGPTAPGWVIPITLATHATGQPITVGYAPTDVTITPDASTLYVTNQDSNTISVVSLNH